MKRLIILIFLLGGMSLYSQQYKVISPRDGTKYVRFEGDSVFYAIKGNTISVYRVQEYWEQDGVTMYVLYNSKEVVNARLIDRRCGKKVLVLWNDRFSNVYLIQKER